MRMLLNFRIRYVIHNMISSLLKSLEVYLRAMARQRNRGVGSIFNTQLAILNQTSGISNLFINLFCSFGDKTCLYFFFHFFQTFPTIYS